VSNIELIDKNRLPQHIAVIMDGNGRWAKQQGKNRIFGHRKGVQSVRNITEACTKLKIPFLTLYAFSTENWGRPSFEVSALMELLVHTIKKETNQLNQNNVRLNAIGNLSMLPAKCYNELNSAMNLTKNNTGLTLTLALSYSSRWEITDAVKKICQEIADNKYGPEDVNEILISQHLCTHNLPDPELLIRTSGEQRVSNFLLWQLAYTEFYFTDKFWPEFDEEEFVKAIISYQYRDRRFGKVASEKQ